MSFKEHKCKKMPSTGVYIHTGIESLEDGNAWGLLLMREATEDDLEEKHHLENVGDCMWSVAVEIAYCPYCGSELI